MWSSYLIQILPTGQLFPVKLLNTKLAIKSGCSFSRKIPFFGDLLVDETFRKDELLICTGFHGSRVYQ